MDSNKADSANSAKPYNTIAREYPSQLESETAMFGDLERFLEDNGIEGDMARDIKLCVSEAFNNAVIHGNGLVSSKSVRLTLSANMEEFVADILDEGKDGLINIESRKKPNALDEGGRGVNLIYERSSDVKLSTETNGGLSIRLVFDRVKKKRNITQDIGVALSSVLVPISQEENMNITKNQSGNVTILNMTGRLDLASGASLKEKVQQEFESGNVKIHLNLSKVDFINSSGLGALVSLMKETRLKHGRMTMSNLAAYVAEIFEITQLSHIFEIYESEESAIASYDTVTPVQ